MEVVDNMTLASYIQFSMIINKTFIGLALAPTSSKNPSMGGAHGIINGSDVDHHTEQFPVEHSLPKYIVFVICCFGIFGNIFSIAVLTHHRVRRTVSSSETVVYYGLILLSVTDLLFCVSLLPRAVVKEGPIFETFGVALVYQRFCTGLITTFSLLSTWLIVVTAGVRYVGICHPLRARYIVSFKVRDPGRYIGYGQDYFQEFEIGGVLTNVWGGCVNICKAQIFIRNIKKQKK